jgi:Domain of unknown function (DUF4126)
LPVNQLISAIALGIGLSACCGFRVFIPLLVAAFAAYFRWMPVNAGMEWLATWPAILCFGTAAVVEVGAYYLPFIDNLLDTLAAPLAIVAGTLVAVTVLPIGELDPLLKWGLGILSGGAAAGTIQVGSGLLRLFSSKTTAGAGNAVVATAENLAAIGGSVGSLLIPLIVGLVLLVLCLYLMVKGFARIGRSR